MVAVVFAMLVALLAFIWVVIDRDGARNTQYAAVADPARYVSCIQCDLQGAESITGFELAENGKSIAKYPTDSWRCLMDAGKCEILFRGSPIHVESKWGHCQVNLFKQGECVGTFRQSGFNYSKKSLRFGSNEYSFALASKGSSDLEVRSGGETLALIAFHPSTGRNRGRRIYFTRSPEIWLEAMICLVGVFAQPRFGHSERV